MCFRSAAEIDSGVRSIPDAAPGPDSQNETPPISMVPLLRSIDTGRRAQPSAAR